MLDEFSCDGTHRHAFRYRDGTAPRATALRERLRRIGACCCDCEMFLNAYVLRADWERRMAGDLADGEDGAEPVPPCQGVRRGSVRPCGNWLLVRPYRG